MDLAAIFAGFVIALVFALAVAADIVSQRAMRRTRSPWYSPMRMREPLLMKETYLFILLLSIGALVVGAFMLLG